MKTLSRWLCAALILVLLMPVLPAAARVTDVTVFIPDRLSQLRLPDMPEIPPEPEYPLLVTDLDKIYFGKNGEPCPVAADPDGDMRLWFTPNVETCDVDDNEVQLDENGYGEIPLELTNIQGIEIEAEYDGHTFSYYASGEHNGVVAHFDNLTVWYDKYGCPYQASLKMNEDFFLSGQPGEASAVIWYIRNQNQVQKKQKDGKVRTGRESVWYVEHVTVNYPYESTVYRVTAHYLNDEKNTLESYTITYNTAFVRTENEDGTVSVRCTDRYAIEYAGKTYPCGGVMYHEDEILKGMYADLIPDVYTLVNGDWIEGKVYINASGKYFGSNRWLYIVDLKPYKGRKNLHRLFDFQSIRREDR